MKRILAILLICTLAMPIPVFADTTDEIRTITVQAPELYDAPSADTAALETLPDVDALKTYLIDAFWDCPEDGVDISAFAIPYSEETISALCDLIWYDTPELFQIGQISISYSQQRGILRLKPVEYYFEKDVYHQMYQECMENADEMLKGIEGNSLLSEAEKALLLHDRLAVHCEYDYKNYDAKNIPRKDYTMYGALGDGVAVCQGYSFGYAYLLNRIGIENEYCSSRLLNHGWNIVTIDGVRYHVDVTWDDQTLYGMVQHDNFLRSTQGIMETGHNWNGQTDFDTSPDSTKYDNYYWQNSATEFQWLNNQMYYVDNKNQKLMSVTNDQSAALLDVKDIWYTPEGMFYTSNYTKLSSDETSLYFSLSKAVYAYNPVTQEKKTAYQPVLDRGWNIYGFTAKNDVFYLDIDEKPSAKAENRALYGQEYRYREKHLIGAEIASLPTKLAYYIGDRFQSDGFAITERHSDGSSTTVTDGISFSGFDSATAGKKTITARHGDSVVTFEVTIKQPVITLSESSHALEEGAQLQLTAETLPAGQKVSWSSSASGVATVSENGLVQAVKKGNAQITAAFTYQNIEYKAICEIQVTHTHQMQMVPEKASTCTEQGNNAYYHCSKCGKDYKDINGETETSAAAEKQPLAAHQGGEATCITAAVCSVCGQSYGEKNLNNHKHTERRNAKAATEEAEGYTGDLYCTDCETQLEQGTVIPKLEPAGLFGDVDGNGSVDAGDALMVLRIAAKLVECPDGVFRLADVNGDNVIDSGDALLILQKAARLISKFPVE